LAITEHVPVPLAAGQYGKPPDPVAAQEIAAFHALPSVARSDYFQVRNTLSTVDSKPRDHEFDVGELTGG